MKCFKLETTADAGLYFYSVLFKLYCYFYRRSYSFFFIFVRCGRGGDAYYLFLRFVLPYTYCREWDAVVMLFLVTRPSYLLCDCWLSVELEWYLKLNKKVYMWLYIILYIIYEFHSIYWNKNNVIMIGKYYSLL